MIKKFFSTLSVLLFTHMSHGSSPSIEIISGEVAAADGTRCGEKYGVVLDGVLIQNGSVTLLIDEDWCLENFWDAYKLACDPVGFGNEDRPETVVVKRSEFEPVTVHCNK